MSLLDYSSGDAALAAGGALAFLMAYLVVVVVICIIVYVVSSLGFYKLYTKMGRDNAWMAWVPFCNIYAQAAFLQEETDSPEWMKWCMAFYYLAGVIPVIGSIVSFAGAVLTIVNECRYVNMHGGQVGQYVLIFLFPIILPYLWIKNYE